MDALSPLGHRRSPDHQGPRALLLAVLLGLIGGLGAGCKEKIPKLSPKECETFCQRLVPCFAGRMANYSMKRKEDTQQCIRDCTSQEGRKHGPILRAMKRCGHLEDCAKLRACFEKSLGS